MLFASTSLGYLLSLLLGVGLVMLLWVGLRRLRARQAAARGALPLAERQSEAEPQFPPAPIAPAESITAVLRRQVPPGEDETPGSWLGGLPELPSDVAWPRSDLDEAPLHFVAQICCADLPAELWAGLGPRAGWLLFFMDPNQPEPTGPDSLRVIHVPTLGPVRHAPDDLGPVHDGTLPGGSYRWLPPQQVPPVWRRWPVDIIGFPNRLGAEDGRSLATPADLAAQLYDGASVLHYRELKGITPYSFGQALNSVALLTARMHSEPREVASPHVRELLAEPGSIAAMRIRLEWLLAKALDSADAAPDGAYLSGLQRCLDLIAGCEEPGDLIARLEAARERHARWRRAVVADCNKLAGLLAAQPSETPLSPDDWRELQDCVMVRQWHGFELRIEYPGSQPMHLDLAERIDRASLEIPAGTGADALVDWLDPATRGRVPANRLAELEAAARSLRGNRPHRMGGYHDGLQSEAGAGPAGALLLLQVASDDAMDWCWGDGGTCFFWIQAEHLAGGDFSQVELVRECD